MTDDRNLQPIVPSILTLILRIREASAARTRALLAGAQA